LFTKGIVAVVQQRGIACAEQYAEDQEPGRVLESQFKHFRIRVVEGPLNPSGGRKVAQFSLHLRK
jgi:hypothetical protein